ncbi:hypothetical protein [Marinobacter adhaerens]|jgi:hypothetical protein|uniref:hypothetical protein n=1 Tax=Marinobacter adhaerens TaxID=1033846 RepID=UPI001E477A2E|nr:hypothetical protein [Marinobacter adhaerens]MCD1649748.1 hypothetical protein [Marinobacter adhaerens]
MEQFQKIESLGLTDKYYDLCNEYPLRVGTPVEKMSSREVLKAADGRVSIQKLKGPGTCYEVQDIPDSVLLRFIIQSRTRVETHLQVQGLEREYVSSFATLCLAAREAAGKERPTPPYPRPEVHSVNELIEVFTRLRDLALEIDRGGQ